MLNVPADASGDTEPLPNTGAGDLTGLLLAGLFMLTGLVLVRVRSHRRS